MFPESASTFDYAVEAVFLAFVAVVAVALEGAFRCPKLVRRQHFGQTRWWLHLPSHGVSYWSVLTVLSSLGIRFLIGSSVHMHGTIVANHGPVRDFLWDILWLFIFGALIVRAAFADTVREFAGWLMWFSGAGVFWSFVGILPCLEPDPQTAALAKGWLVIHLVQLMIALVLWVLSKPEIRGSKQQVTILVLLALAFAGLFVVDLCHMLDSSLTGCICSVFHT